MRKKSYRGYRHPHTTQERRQNQDGWGRGCRSGYNLPNVYDDIPVRKPGRNWKDSRKTQYRGRGKKHETFIADVRRWQIWSIKEFFENHDIPYRIEEVNRTSYFWCYGFWRTEWDMRKLKYIYTWQPYPKPRRYRKITSLGQRITWWADKDIGLKHILPQIKHY